MFTTFEKDVPSKELYFKLNNSLQITNFDAAGKTMKFSGLYAIYKNDVCYYVGQSQNIASRLSQHLTGKYKDCDTVFLMLLSGDELDHLSNLSKLNRKELLEANELALMRILKPVENLITPKDEFSLCDKNRFTFIEWMEDGESMQCSQSACLMVDGDCISVSCMYNPIFMGLSSLAAHNAEAIRFNDNGHDISL